MSPEEKFAIARANAHFYVRQLTRLSDEDKRIELEHLTCVSLDAIELYKRVCEDAKYMNEINKKLSNKTHTP